MKFRTTNSTYEITRRGPQYYWRRLEESESSGKLCTVSGPLICKPEIRMGERAWLFCPAIKKGTQARYIVTTPVTEIWP